LEITQEAAPFPSLRPDGILGLGLPGLVSPPMGSFNHPPTAIEMLQAQYAAQLGDETTYYFQMEQGKDVLIFGGNITDRYLDMDGVNWVPVQRTGYDYGYWLLSMEGVTIGGKAGHSRLGIVDSGTSCLTAPAKDLQLFQSFMPGGSARISDLPHVQFDIGGKTYELTPQQYVVNGQVCVQAGPDQFWILGDVFHRAFPVTYDYGNHRVGLPASAPSAPFIIDWESVGILIIILLGICALAVCCCRQYRAMRQPQQMRQPMMGRRPGVSTPGVPMAAVPQPQQPMSAAEVAAMREARAARYGPAAGVAPTAPPGDTVNLADAGAVKQAVARLVAMGFNDAQARKALADAGGHVDRAAAALLEPR